VEDTRANQGARNASNSWVRGDFPPQGDSLLGVARVHLHVQANLRQPGVIVGSR